MTMVARIARNFDVLTLLEAFTGTVCGVTRLLLASPAVLKANSLYTWRVKVDLDAYRQCVDWQIDNHVWQLQAEEAVARWEWQRYRCEELDADD